MLNRLCGFCFGRLGKSPKHWVQRDVSGQDQFLCQVIDNLRIAAIGIVDGALPCPLFNLRDPCYVPAGHLWVVGITPVGTQRNPNDLWRHLLRLQQASVLDFL